MSGGAADASALDALARELFDEVRRLSADTDGVNRPAFSAVETRVLDYLAGFAAAQGLDVAEDAGRNLVISRSCDRAAERWALIGSHVDSVPQGGNFDGLAGVVAGLLLLIEAERSGRTFRLPVKCLAMRAEESAWFGLCYIGSRVLTGQIGAPDLEAPHRGDGRPLAAHMADIGIDMAKVGRGPLMDLAQVAEYLELHIEQGPLLVELGRPAAVVTGIRGNFRHQKIRCVGEAAHSGAVPRQYRHDPVMAMAELMAGLDRTWDRISARKGDLVVTSGMVETDPTRHALARIADEITFSLDIRSLDAVTLAEMRKALAAQIEAIETRRGVRFVPGRETSTEPALMDPGVVAGLLDAMEARGQMPFSMPSGGGHDAAVFAQAGIPAGMVFVRNRNGSHNPQEAMEIADLLAGMEILSAYFEGGAARRPAGDRQTMYTDLVDELLAKGRGVHAFSAVAGEAFARARRDTTGGAGWFVLAQLAEDFVQRFDRMPLPQGALEAVCARFARHAAALDAAAGSAEATLDAIAAAARDVARAREDLPA